MRLILSLFFLLLSSAASAADHAVILQYHHFGSNTPPSTSVTMEQFRKHVDYLSENAFTVWPLDRIIAHLKNKVPLPEKCVSITIDDAYISIYENAFPLLKRHGWPFTVFVATEAVDKGYREMLSWDQMRKMAESGGAFAGHTDTHAYLLHKTGKETEAQWKARITEDIKKSFARIHEELGTASTLFAYPYGEYNTAVKKIVTGLGLTGFGQQSGPAWSGSDFGIVPRFALAAGYAEMDGFITKVHSLPLPVLSASPEDPVVFGNDPRPALRLILSGGAYSKESLSCFLSGRGTISLQWVDRERGIVEAVSDRPLPEGRSRYNFTAMHTDGIRYFWYSHLWIHSYSY